MPPGSQCKVEIKVNLHNLYYLTREYIPVIKI